MNRRASSVFGVLVGVVALAVLALPASAAGGQTNVLRVGPGEQYATIQDAVDAAGQGSKILVYPTSDDYREQVWVTTNNLELLAQGDNVTVRPPDLLPDQGPEDSLPAGFVVAASHVTIRGFRIGFGGGCAPAIAFKGSHNTFADNYMYQAQSCPEIAAVNGHTDVPGSDYNTFERNTITGGYQGMLLGGIRTDVVTKGDIIRDNTFIEIATYPIGLQNSAGALVSGNHIDLTQGSPCIEAVSLPDTELPTGGHTIVGNTLENCLVGISLNTGPNTVMTNVRISKNTIVDCKDNCIALYAGSGARLTNNEVSYNSISASSMLNGIALQVDEGGVVSGNLIIGNRVSDNKLSGISLWPGADDNRIFNNEVFNNNSAALPIAAGIAVAGKSNLIVGNVAQGNKVQDLLDLGQGNRWVNNTYDTMTP